MKSDLEKLSDKDLTEYIRKRLSEDANWCRHALMALLAEQTEDERAAPDAVHHRNGRGFSPQDQEFLTSLAYQVRKNVTLSERQVHWCKKLLPKYAGQLVRIIREERAEVDSKEEKPSQPIVSSTRLYLMSEFEINNSTHHLLGISGNLGILETRLPAVIVVRSNSGLQEMKFERTGEGYSADGQTLEAVFYKTGYGIYEWKMTILIAPPDQPAASVSVDNGEFPKHLLLSGNPYPPLIEP